MIYWTRSSVEPRALLLVSTDPPFLPNAVNLPPWGTEFEMYRGLLAFIYPVYENHAYFIFKGPFEIGDSNIDNVRPTVRECVNAVHDHLREKLLNAQQVYQRFVRHDFRDTSSVCERLLKELP